MAGQVASALLSSQPTTVVSVPLVGGAPLVDAVFIARPNRFVIEAQLASGEVVQAHVADRGRLIWLVPGLRLWLGHKPAAGRKTAYQVAAVQRAGVWSSLDTHLPNRLIEHALRLGALPQFAAYAAIQREVTFGTSRFDFCLTQPASHGPARCVVEVKSAGDVVGGLASFPDAPTLRGARHLTELAALHQAGTRTAVVFVVQAAGANAIQANRQIDPGFAQTLAHTRAVGVEVYGYACRIDRTGIVLERALPVLDVPDAAHLPDRDVAPVVSDQETRL